MEQNTVYYGNNYANLPEEVRGIFESLNVPRSYYKNEMIYMQGEYADCFYYLKQGRARIYFLSPEGTEKTLANVESGCILGEAAFFDGMPRVSSAVALSECLIIPVNEKILTRRFRIDPDFAMTLLNLQARSIRMLSSQVSSITFLQANCRIARLLIQLCEPCGEGEYCVRLTHEEIGNIIGVSRVTVSKILNSMRGSGMIKTQYREIVIENLHELYRIANFEEA